MNYGLAAQQDGDLKLATEKLLAAAAQNPESISTFAQRMFRQSNQEQVLQHGITIYSNVVERLANNPYAHYHYGLFQSYSRHFDEAASAFKNTELLVQESSQGTELLNAFFYFLYAAAVERTGDIQEAEALFFECLEKDAKHAEAYNYMAYMWAENNMKLDKALKYINKGLALVPKNGAFLDTKGWIMYQKGSYEEAFDLLEQAITLIPEDPTINAHFGDVLLKLDRREEARKHFEQALKLEPDNEALREKLAEAMAEKVIEEPMPEKAIQEDATLEEDAPDEPAAQSNEVAEVAAELEEAQQTTPALSTEE